MKFLILVINRLRTGKCYLEKYSVPSKKISKYAPAPVYDMFTLWIVVMMPVKYVNG